jgi:hypothetical protein
MSQAQGQPSDYLSRADAWLVRHRRWVLATLVLLAAATRVCYFVQLNAGPLVETHRWDGKDMNYFDFWARRICDGDWLSADVPLPLHAWHKQLASICFRDNPQLLAELQQQAQAEGNTRTVEQLVWRRAAGAHRIWQEPLYPYLVALTYSVLGPDPRWVLAWQMALGVAGVILVYRISERHFGATAAFASGLLYVFCRPLVMHEGILLRDASIAIFGLVLVELTDWALQRRSPWRWGLLGGAFGLAILLKSVYSPYLLGLVVAATVLHWRQWRFLGQSLAATFLGILLICGPWIARNVSLGVPPLSVGGELGRGALAVYNSADVKWESCAFISPDLAKDLAKREPAMLPTIIKALQTHPNLWSVVGMVWNKFDAAWHWWERPDNVDSYFYEIYMPILAWLPVTVGVLSPLAIVGLLLAVRRFSQHIALYLFVLTAIAPLLLCIALARFRLPLVVAMIPFAGYATAQTIGWFGRQQWFRGAATVACIAGLALWIDRPLPASISLYRSCDYADVFNNYFQPRARQALQSQDWRRAADILADCVRREPPGLTGRPTALMAPNSEERNIAEILADINNGCGSLYAQAGDRAAAEKHFARAAELKQFSQQ